MCTRSLKESTTAPRRRCCLQALHILSRVRAVAELSALSFESFLFGSTEKASRHGGSPALLALMPGRALRCLYVSCNYVFPWLANMLRLAAGHAKQEHGGEAANLGRQEEVPQVASVLLDGRGRCGGAGGFGHAC